MLRLPVYLISAVDAMRGTVSMNAMGETVFQAFTEFYAHRPGFDAVAFVREMRDPNATAERVALIEELNRRGVRWTGFLHDMLKFAEPTRADVVDLLDDAVIAADADDAVTIWNTAAERMFGWTRSEAIGLNHLLLLADDLTPEQRVGCMATLHASESYRRSGSWRGKDDRVVHGEVVTSPIMHGDEYAGFVSVVRPSAAAEGPSVVVDSS